jgi:hypothetical protein
VTLFATILDFICAVLWGICAMTETNDTVLFILRIILSIMWTVLGGFNLAEYIHWKNKGY